MKILFVCTGNSCRSPMAEHIARDMFERAGMKCEFASAGVSVLMALPASEHAVRICEARGFDLSSFRTKQVTAEHIEWADLILTMTDRHKAYLNLKLSGDTGKIFTLAEYLDCGETEISDPFGGDFEVYSACAAQLEEKIEMLVNKLKMEANVQNGGIKKPIAIGCDHAGFELKQQIIDFMRSEAIDFTDYGTYDKSAVDYPEYALKVAEAVSSGEHEKGILLCGTGIGVSMAANRIKSIRCALCHDVFSAKATREHNDANILAMGGRVIGAGHAIEIVGAFLNTEFSGDEKHVRRIGMY